MAKESLFPISKSGVIFKETFNSANDTERNGGDASNVSFSGGIGSFNGSTSVVNYISKHFDGAYSVRIKLNKLGSIGSRYIIDNLGSNADGTGYILISGNNILKSSGTVYINGSATISIQPGVDSEIIVSGISLITGTGANKFLVGSKSTDTDYYWGTIDFIEIYDRTLTAEEISNLYNNKQYAGLVQGSLAAYWDLTQQSAYDYSGNGNNGTLTPGTGGYKKGHGLEFDGSATRIEIPASSDFNIGANDFSICATLKTNINTLTKIIFARWGSSTTREFSFQTTNIGVLYFYCSGDGTNLINFQSYPNKILTDTWYFVCFTKTGLTGKLYRAGMYDKSGIEEISRLGGVVSSLYFNIDSATEIGTRQRVIGEWDGNMKQLAFYNGKALSAEEIAQNYQYSKSRFFL
jgi:hypothetical protein